MWQKSIPIQFFDEVVEGSDEPFGLLLHFLSYLIAAKTNKGVLKIDWRDNQSMSQSANSSYGQWSYRGRTGLEIGDPVTNHYDSLVALQVFEVGDHLCLSVLL